MVRIHQEQVAQIYSSLCVRAPLSYLLSPGFAFVMGVFCKVQVQCPCFKILVQFQLILETVFIFSP